MPSKPDDLPTNSSRDVEKKTLTRKVKKSTKGSTVESMRTNDNAELFNRDLNTTNFSKKPVISSYSRGYGIFVKEIGKKGRVPGETVVDGQSSLHSSGPQKSGVSEHSLYFKNVSHSRASLRTLPIKKSEEMTDFISETFEPDACNIRCAAETLTLVDEGSKVPARSDLCLSDSILNEIHVDSRDIRDEKEILSYVPFQKNENTVKESHKSVIKTNGRKRLRNFCSKNPILNKSQVMSFFARGEKHATVPEMHEPNIEQSQLESEKQSERKKERKEMVIKYLDPPVPVEEDLAIKASMRGLLFFYLQLICITLIGLTMVSPEMYYFTALTAREFFDTPFFTKLNTTEMGGKPPKDIYRKTLRKSTTVEDFWIFCETTLVTALYSDFYSLKMNRRSLVTNDPKKMFNENRVLGVARIRQVKVKKNSCKVHQDVRKFVDNCYDRYSVFSEDTKPIKKGMKGKATSTAWVYTEAKHLNSSYYWGEIAIYGGGGYYLDLAPNKEGGQKMISELKENDWITSATRAVFINFNIYNANVNLFCLCKIILEFPPVGGVIPVQDFHSLKLIRYVNTHDFFILGLECVYILFVLQNTIEEIKTIYRESSSYVFFGLNILNFTKLLLSYLCIILSILRKVYSTLLISNLEYNYPKYTEFNLVKNLQIAYDSVMAILVFVTWIKLFTVLNFTKTMLQFKKALAKSLVGMIEFLPMFLTMFTAFVFLAYLLFGNQVDSYRTIWLSFLTLLQALLGEFNFSLILESNGVLGSFFYILFVFFMFFMLVNVFIAIIIDAYRAVKSQIIPDSPRIMEYSKRGLINLFTCGRPMKLRKCRKITKKKLLFEDIKKALRTAGFKENEINIFFHKYNINCRNFIEEKTKTRIMKDLELKGVNFQETSDEFKIDALRRRLDEFKERMENWEVRLQPVIDKVDILLHRL